MTVEQAVIERLQASADVTALVSTRIYQLTLPQKPTLPAIRVQLISEPRTYQLRGEDGAIRARVQVDAYAAEGNGTDPYAAAHAVAEAVRGALSGKRFTVGSPAITVMGAMVDNRRVLYEAGELRSVNHSQDFIVWWRWA